MPVAAVWLSWVCLQLQLGSSTELRSELTVAPAAQGPPWTLWAPLCHKAGSQKPPWALIPPHTKPQTASWLANHTRSAPDRRATELLPPWGLLGSQTENKAGTGTKAALLKERDALLSSDGSGG